MLEKNKCFFGILKKFKKKTALIIENGEQISYNQLLSYSTKLEKILTNNKNLVFLLGQNNLETITGYISFVNKGYAVFLIDYRINQVFLKKLINLYKPNLIFTPKKIFELNKFYKSKLNFKSYILLQKRININHNINKDLMLLMSTSGSTGSPKLVRQSYQNLKSNIDAIIKYLKIKGSDTTITSLPISYVYGLSVINTHLIRGATVVLTNKSMIEKNFWQILKKFKVNNFAGVPYNYSIIDKIFKNKLPNTLKYSTQAGGKMDKKLLKKILLNYKKNKIKFIQMYGAAEATSRMSYLNWNDSFKRIGSIGKVIPGGKFHLIDSKGKKIIKPFQKGELVYEGKNVFMGYAEKLKDLNLPDLNNGRLYTGDIAYMDKDKFYYVEGRKNRYAKIFGLRINLSDLENILHKKGLNSMMKEIDQNKICIYVKEISKIKKHLQYLSKITSINQNVFVVKKMSKNNLTFNYKYKI